MYLHRFLSGSSFCIHIVLPQHILPSKLSLDSYCLLIGPLEFPPDWLLSQDQPCFKVAIVDLTTIATAK